MAAHQVSPSLGSSRQEYWSGVQFLSPGDLPNPGIEPGSPAFQADALTSEPPGKHKLYAYGLVKIIIYLIQYIVNFKYVLVTEYTLYNYF